MSADKYPKWVRVLLFLALCYVGFWAQWWLWHMLIGGLMIFLFPL